MATVLVTTLAGLRSFGGIPQNDDIYEITDYGTGIWYYDSADTTSADNTGTIVVSGSYRFKRIFSEPVLQAVWFGVVADGTTDNFDALQDSINAVYDLNAANLLLPSGVIYLSKNIGGAIQLQNDANPLTITGAGKTKTIIKLSKNVPRLFDLPFGGNLTNTILYKNITLRDFTVDANGISSVDIGDEVTVTGSSIINGTGLAFIDIPVTTNVSYIDEGIVYFPSTAASSTIRDKFRKFIKHPSDPNVLKVFLHAGDVVTPGDHIKGGMFQHVLIGTNSDGYASSTDKNINIDGITIENVDIINVFTEAGENEASGYRCATQRSGVHLSTRPNDGTYNDHVYTKNILVDNMRIEGGNVGIWIAGVARFGLYYTTYLHNIIVKNSYHTTESVLNPSFEGYESQTFGVNLLIGGQAFGDLVKVYNFTGIGSGDVGIEVNSVMNATIENCQVYNAYGSGYNASNYKLPAPTIEGPPQTTLGADIINKDITSITLSTIPAGIKKNGYLAIQAVVGSDINVEWMYYVYTSGSSTLQVIRNLNNLDVSKIPSTYASGLPVYFSLVEEQNIIIRDCTYINDSLVTTILNAPPAAGYMQLRNAEMFAALPPIKILDCSYVRTTPDYGWGGGEAISISGNNPSIEIRGFRADITSVNYTAGVAGFASIISIKNKDNKDTPPTETPVNTGATPPVYYPVPAFPYNKLTMSDIRINANGIFNIVYGIAAIVIDQGVWDIDLDKLFITMKNLSTVSNKLYGLHFGGSASNQHSYFMGKIGHYGFTAIGDNEPRGMWGGAWCDMKFPFVMDMIDYSYMEYDNTSGTNNKYVPIDLPTAVKSNIRFRTFVHPLKSTTLNMPQTYLRGVKFDTGASYDARFDNEYVGVTSTSNSRVITLPKIVTSSAFKNYNAEIEIADELFNAATSLKSITINPFSGENINGASSAYVINTNGGVVRFRSTDVGWIIVKKVV